MQPALNDPFFGVSPFALDVRSLSDPGTIHEDKKWKLGVSCIPIIGDLFACVMRCRLAKQMLNPFNSDMRKYQLLRVAQKYNYSTTVSSALTLVAFTFATPFYPKPWFIAMEVSSVINFSAQVYVICKTASQLKQILHAQRTVGVV